MSAQNIEFLILGFNGQSVTLACLKSITSFAPSASVTFLDNGSTEEMQVIKSYISANSNWHYLRSETNLGVTKGRNLLLSRSSGDILVFMDNDAQLTGSISEILIEAISNEENIGMVGKEGILFDPDLNDYLYRGNMQVDAVPGYFQAFSRRFYLEVGKLDERFDLYWMEDMDYCLEGKKKGFKNMIIENLPVEHLEHISSSFLDDETKKQKILTNRQLFISKWSSQLDILEINRAHIDHLSCLNCDQKWSRQQ